MVRSADLTVISDYSSLQDAIIEYLAREGETTITARVPTFIQLTEAKLNRELFTRQMEQRSTAIVNTSSSEPEFISLPDDFQSMRRIRLSSVTGKPGLDFVTGVSMDEFRRFNADTTGRPIYFTIIGDEIELAPTPDQAYTIEMVYRKNIPDLADNSTNWLLDLAPDIYLYGALLEAAPYMQNDERIQTWLTGFASALDGLNRLSLSATFNAGPLNMRVSGITP
jgi:hypothetical protein